MAEITLKFMKFESLSVLFSEDFPIKVQTVVFETVQGKKGMEAHNLEIA